MAFEDKTLVCRDCNREFTFSAGEQEFYESRGLQNEPGRCFDCRREKRQGRFGQGPREMHKAICGSCGAECEVPFQPRGDRPVYCSDCFSTMRTRE